MPSIDEFQIKPKYRSWDDDILTKLKISEQPETTENNLRKPQIQTRHELRKESEINWSQTGAKLEPTFTQTGAKLGTEVEPKVEPNWSQTGAKLEPTESFFSLPTLQKEITIFIHNLCKISRDKKTKPVVIEQIAASCQSTIAAVKKAIQRLEKKKVINRLNFKNGRGGWSIYELANMTFQELLFLETGAKLEPNWSQTGAKLGTEVEPQVEPTPPSSSSYYIYNNKYNNINQVTTKENTESIEADGDFPIEWKKINYGPLRHIGFSETQLLQLYSKKLNIPEVVQESIYHFAFGLENVEKTKGYKDPLNVLMGVLRQGHAWIETNYESVTDRALRQILEEKQRANEKRVNLHKEIFELEFKNWFTSVSEKKLKELLPEVNFSFGKYSGEVENQAKNLFRRTEWVAIYEDITSKTTS